MCEKIKNTKDKSEFNTYCIFTEENQEERNNRINF